MSPIKIPPPSSQARFKNHADDLWGRRCQKSLRSHFSPWLPVPKIFTFHESLAARTGHHTQCWPMRGQGKGRAVTEWSRWGSYVKGRHSAAFISHSPVHFPRSNQGGSFKTVKQITRCPAQTLRWLPTAVGIKPKLFAVGWLPLPLQGHWVRPPPRAAARPDLLFLKRAKRCPGSRTC